MSRPLLFPTLLSVLLLLGACASPALEAPYANGDADPRDAFRAPDASGEPDADLVEEWTYSILVAEFAGHRGELDTASSYYLQAARLTREPKVIERAIRVALTADDSEQAVQGARLLTEVQPQRADAFRLLAVAYLRSGDVQQTVQALDRVVDLDPGNASESFAVAAAILSGEDDQEPAWQAMQSLVERHNHDPEAYLALARLGARWQRFDDALAALAQAHRLRPGWDEAQLLQAQIQVLQGKPDEAAATMLAGVEANPDNAGMRRFYGQLLLEQKHYDKAIEQFSILAQQQPEDGEILLTLGALYLQVEDKQHANEVFERLLALPEYQSDAHYYLGQVAEVSDDMALARSHYQQVGAGRHFMDAQVRLAVVLTGEQQLDQALKVLDKLNVEDANDFLRVALIRGELLRDAGEYQRAYDAYTTALGDLPGNDDLLYARAMVSESMGRVDWLEKDLGEILKDDPEHVQALNAMGYTLADQTDRYIEALGYIRRAIALKPDDYYILDSMGWVQYRLGNYESALKYLRQALEKQQDVDIASHLGEVLWVSGEHDEARRVWRKGLGFDGDTELIRETMRRLMPAGEMLKQADAPEGRSESKPVTKPVQAVDADDS